MLGAQAQCTGDMYVAREAASGTGSRLNLVDTSVYPVTLSPIGSAISFFYNAMGRHPVSGDLYALNQSSNFRQLIRIDSATGATTTLGLVTGLANTEHNAGTFDEAGSYWVKQTGNNRTLYRINNVLTASTASPASVAATVTLNRDILIADMAFVTGELFAVTNDGQLVKIDVNSGVVTDIGSADTSGRIFGSQFGAPNGLYGASNAGEGLYRIDTTTGVQTRVSALGSSDKNDGANCPQMPILFSADLAITKTDGNVEYTPGAPVTYTIVARNNGPHDAYGTKVSDLLPAGITTANWTCTPSGVGASCTTSGTGAINDTVNLPRDGSVTYTLTMNVPANFTGNLANTATVTVPPFIEDPNPSNNTTTDTDNSPTTADLAIVKTSNSPVYTPGSSLVYTINVSNTGPAAVSGATVRDLLPAGITTANWSCVPGLGAACTASGTGAINDSAVTLPVGGSVTYTLFMSIPGGQTGSLANTATVEVPAGGPTDPNPSNNTSTSTTTPSATPPRSSDLMVTKTSTTTGSYTAGGTVTYTIVASNNGPDATTGAVVYDALPTGITGTWTCVGSGGGSCTATGTGSINDTVNLPVGAKATYTLIANVPANFTGALVNNVRVVTTDGADSVPGNNTASLTIPAPTQANLGITKTDGKSSYTPGTNAVYTIVATNYGPAAATDVTVSDPLPAGISSANWTCTAVNGGTCTASGSGALNDSVNLPVGASVTYTLSMAVPATFTGDLVNKASVKHSAGGGLTDPDPSNDTATDTDTQTKEPSKEPAPVPVGGTGLLLVFMGLLGTAIMSRRRSW